MALAPYTSRRNDVETIDKRRAAIRTRMAQDSYAVARGMPEALEERDIGLLLRLYDEFFFEGQLYMRLEGRITYRFSNRMTKTGGRVRHDRKKKTYELALSRALIVRPFSEEGRSYLVNGIRVASSIDAMMCIMEHELVHILEFELNGSSSCGKHPFKTMARNIFGHTDTKHALRIDKENGGTSGLSVGTRVRFNYRGSVFTGTITRITKRATVVLDASCKGAYQRFYVPLDMLTAIPE